MYQNVELVRDKGLRNWVEFLLESEEKKVLVGETEQ